MKPSHLLVICGPMFSGKSTELVRRVEANESTGRAALVIKPSWDGRYQSTAPQVVTHDGIRRAAVAAADAEEARRLAASAEPGTLIAIDEAHFFGAALAPVVTEMLAAGRRVLISGVEIDHRGQPFEPFPTLLAHADEVVKLAARCHQCGAPARFSQRMIAHDFNARIVVGGAETYQARCRTCFQPAVDS